MSKTSFFYAIPNGESNVDLINLQLVNLVLPQGCTLTYFPTCYSFFVHKLRTNCKFILQLINLYLIRNIRIWFFCITVITLRIILSLDSVIE